MGSHIIYHPRRETQMFGEQRVYFDSLKGNQDPYVWNGRFLHTYCHMTELRNPQPGDINFWVSGDTFPDFNALYCDLVFVVGERCEWRNRNRIHRNAPVVDSEQAYNDHYRWAFQHPFTRRSRFTLKADPEKSYQPQKTDGCLIDILPKLEERGVTRECVRAKMRRGFASTPMEIGRELALELYDVLCGQADVKLVGCQLQVIREGHPELASPQPRHRRNG